jgi:hypothetical protein
MWPAGLTRSPRRDQALDAHALLAFALPVRLAHPLRVWTKVVAILVLLDVVLFRVGLAWKVTPDFGTGSNGLLLAQVFDAARTLETHAARPTNAVIVGSSVLVLGVNAAQANVQLGRRGLPVELVDFGVFGASTTDAALLAWQGMRLTPWLVVYAASARDFYKHNQLDTPLVRTFYDSSADLPSLPRESFEAVLDAHVRRYWRLYRYGLLLRAGVDRASHRLLSQVGSPSAVFAAGSPPPPLPAEAVQRFGAVTPEAFAAWEHWRETRRFDDYARWIATNRGENVLDVYRTQTIETCGPEANPHATSLDWLVTTLARRHTRTVLLYFPENPVFTAPEARPYFDPALSDAQAALLAHEAAAHDARFVDLRHLLAPEDFMDLVHPNREGNRKLTEAITQLIAEEWLNKKGS